MRARILFMRDKDGHRTFMTAAKNWAAIGKSL